MLRKVKLNPEDMLSLEISRAAYASLSIEEKKILSVKKAGIMGLSEAFLTEIEYIETTHLPHFQPLKKANIRFNINTAVIRFSHRRKVLNPFQLML